MGRMIQHTMPKGFKRIRYDGMQVMSGVGLTSTKTIAKLKAVVTRPLHQERFHNVNRNHARQGPRHQNQHREVGRLVDG
jgi:hypothetical protein